MSKERRACEWRDLHIEEARRLIESMFDLMDIDQILAMRGGVRTWLEIAPEEYEEHYKDYDEWKDAPEAYDEN
jgi:hypothetical protein